MLLVFSMRMFNDNYIFVYVQTFLSANVFFSRSGFLLFAVVRLEFHTLKQFQKQKVSRFVCLDTNLRFCGSRLVQEERWYANFAAAQIGVGHTKTV